MQPQVMQVYQQPSPAWIFIPIGCFAAIVWFIVNILLCVWVYRDAESRGMGGALWLIIILIGGIVGLIIYLVVRKEKAGAPPLPPTPPTQPIPPVMRMCTACGRVVSPDARFCPHCGKALPD